MYSSLPSTGVPLSEFQCGIGCSLFELFLFDAEFSPFRRRADRLGSLGHLQPLVMSEGKRALRLVPCVMGGSCLMGIFSQKDVGGVAHYRNMSNEFLAC